MDRCVRWLDMLRDDYSFRAKKVQEALPHKVITAYGFIWQHMLGHLVHLRDFMLMALFMVYIIRLVIKTVYMLIICNLRYAASYTLCG